jgi:cell division protein FtsL
MDERAMAMQLRQALDNPGEVVASGNQELIDVEAEREAMMRAQIEDQLALQMSAQQVASMPRHYMGKAEMEFLTAAGLTKSSKSEISPPVVGEFLSSPDLRHLALSSLDIRETAMQKRRILISRALSESRQKEKQAIEWERRALESSLMSKSLRVSGRQTMVEMLAAPVNRTETKVNTTNQRAPGFLSALIPRKRE